MKNFTTQQKKKGIIQRGFTLIELLVTITIFVVLTGVVLVHQNSFNNTILLSNLAYDTALTVRQAQTYGVNTQETRNGTFASSTGVSFNTDTTIGGSTVNFILFADTVGANGSGNPDGLYDGSVTSCPVSDPECLQKYTVRNGSSISAMCVGSNDSDCAQTPTKQLTVLFTRPNPDAKIFITNPNATFTYAKITVSSAGNVASKSIVVTATGQIYVQ